MLNYLNQGMDQLKCNGWVRVVEAVNGNIRMLINRGRGYQNLRYLLLKAQRMAVTNVEFIAVRSIEESRVKWHLSRILTQSRKKQAKR